MSNKNRKLTKESYEKLKKDLEYLESVKRKEVAENLKHAASFGDLSENSAYDDAKEEQSNLETKISKMRKMLKDVQVIKESSSTQKVQVGSCITVEIDGDKKKIKIVGGMEADPFEGKISCDSPIGQKLLGKRKGETCNVSTPAGEKKYKIIEIT